VIEATHRIASVEGTALPLRGDDIDTDRIIPARYLRTITFEGMEHHVFEDDRRTSAHPFDDPRFQGARILLVNGNFGCGSSREHAPQALRDWGIRGIVAGSFAEIFFGNCITIGIPCLAADLADIDWLQRAIGRSPQEPVVLDVAKGEVRFGDRVIRARIPDGARSQLVTGGWNGTAVLLEAGAAIESTARKLPYLTGF